MRHGCHMATGDWEILIRKFVLMERHSELVTFSERVAIGVTIRVDKSCGLNSVAFSSSQLLRQSFPRALIVTLRLCVPLIPM